ncbi:UPF0047 protein YjbQ-like isoform X2 [Scylla paramamosain]|uniref:UPF0047 protein YjbQ-like isoform X2 n=1 Tax=Scylla paramamosain TaxID=85552 RepID=UPI0030839CD0
MASSSRGIQIGSAWFQRKIKLRPQHRGIHLVTDEVLKEIPELRQFSVGLLHVQILHTSASLALNENWDPYVRDDMEMMLNKIVPEPAHVKACFIGSSLTLPISEGKLNLGTWQGIWLCEHRNDAGPRKIVATINGCLRDGRTPVSPMSPMASTSS